MLTELKARIPDLDERLSELTAPNEKDTRFSGPKFMVNSTPASSLESEVIFPQPDLKVDPSSTSSLESTISLLQQDLIVVKVSGKLLLDEKEDGENLTKRKYLIKTLTLMSQLGLNVFLIHGGQEQIDRNLRKNAELNAEVRKLSMLKNSSVRYTHTELMPMIIRTSNRLSNNLKMDIIKSGGNANAYTSSLFIGNALKDFTFTEDQLKEARLTEAELKIIGIDRNDMTLYGNNCVSLPLDERLQSINRREERILKYLRGNVKIDLVNETTAPGKIVIFGWLANSADPLIELGVDRVSRDDPYVGNGDADNISLATALYFSNRKIVPVGSKENISLVEPKRVHVIEMARNGGLRKGPNDYQNIVDIVTSERDLERNEIMGGMRDKVKNSLKLARALEKKHVPSMVKIIHMRELLPYLLGKEQEIRSEFREGYGTTFAPRGLDRLDKEFSSMKNYR